MGLSEYPLPPLLGGISQQPESIRRPNQVSECENMILSILDGLKTRSGSYKVSTMSSTEGSINHGYATDIYHSFTASNGDVFLIIIKRTGFGSGTITAYRLMANGTEVTGALTATTINGLSALPFSSYSYLSGVPAGVQYQLTKDTSRIINIGDNAILLNTSVQPRWATSFGKDGLRCGFTRRSFTEIYYGATKIVKDGYGTQYNPGRWIPNLVYFDKSTTFTIASTTLASASVWKLTFSHGQDLSWAVIGESITTTGSSPLSAEYPISNNGTFPIVGIGANYLEVTNATGQLTPDVIEINGVPTLIPCTTVVTKARSYMEFMGGVWKCTRTTTINQGEFDPTDWTLVEHGDNSWIDSPIVTDIGETPSIISRVINQYSTTAQQSRVALTPGILGFVTMSNYLWWGVGGSYVEGDIRLYVPENKYYICLENHTSVNFAGDKISGYWQQMPNHTLYRLRAVTPNALPASNPKKVVWKPEWEAVNMTCRPDPAYMPHILKYNGSNQFTFSPIEWDALATTLREAVTDPVIGRQYKKGTIFIDQNVIPFRTYVALSDMYYSGDLTIGTTAWSGPDRYSNSFIPSFMPYIDTATGEIILGKSMSDILHHRSRLWVSSLEYLVSSVSGEEFNFFPKDPQGDVISTDPIDVAVSSSGSVDIKTLVSSNNDMIISTKNRQFKLSASEVMSPLTASIKETTNYEFYSKIKPMVLGGTLLFVEKGSRANRISEYSFSDQVQGELKTEITAHVPTLLEGEIVQMAMSTANNIMTIMTRLDANVLKIYSYFMRGPDREQLAWHKFRFDNINAIHHIFFVNNIMYMVCATKFGAGNTLSLEKIYLSNEPDDLTVTYPTKIVNVCLKLDHKQTIIGTGTTTITWNLSAYSSSQYDGIVFVTNDGSIYSKSDLVGGNLIVDGVGTTLIVGFPYNSFVIPSKIYRKSQEGVSFFNGRSQLYYTIMDLKDTYNLKVIVTPDGGNASTQTFESKVIGVQHIGEILAPFTGQSRFNILGDAKTTQIKILNDSHLPSTIAGINHMMEGAYYEGAQ